MTADSCCNSAFHADKFWCDGEWSRRMESRVRTMRLRMRLHFKRGKAQVSLGCQNDVVCMRSAIFFERCIASLSDSVGSLELHPIAGVEWVLSTPCIRERSAFPDRLKIAFHQYCSFERQTCGSEHGDRTTPYLGRSPILDEQRRVERDIRIVFFFFF